MDEILDLDFEDLLKVRLAQIPAQDALVFTLGAILGYKGYTPVTALINILKGGGDKAGVRTSDIITELIAPTTVVVDVVIGYLLGGTAPAHKQTPKEELEKNVMNAMIGALESYALTRPGAIGGILQGIGAILPL